MNLSRETIPLATADVSLFCKNLREQLATAGVTAPGHLTLLNMLARSAGYRNYQMLKARPPAPLTPCVEEEPANAIALPRGSSVPLPVRRLLACFDTRGRLMRWPNKYAAQQIAIWALWSRLPSHREMTEKEVNGYLDAFHTYGDPATLRRELVNARLLSRTVDCRVYRKEVRRPNEATQQFLKTLFGLVTPPRAGRLTPA